jgi:hypothetical protein
MKVSELIEKLEAFDPEMQVCICAPWLHFNINFEERISFGNSESEKEFFNKEVLVII